VYKNEAAAVAAERQQKVAASNKIVATKAKEQLKEQSCHNDNIKTEYRKNV